MNDEKEKTMIVVVAGNRKEFEQWVRENVIPVTCMSDEHKLMGQRVDKVYYIGTYRQWLCEKMFAILDTLQRRRGAPMNKIDKKEILICTICKNTVDRCSCSINTVLQYPVWLQRIKIKEGRHQ